MGADLQELVDDLAAQLARPVSLEDRRWRLLAYSAHTELQDRVRQASILSRAAPADVVAYLDTLRLDQRTEPVLDTPANAAIEMGPRSCAPVRSGDTLLGFLWVIPGAVPLDEAERTTLAAAAVEVAATLARRRASEHTRNERTAALLATLFDARDPAARAEGAAALAAEQGWTLESAFAVALATCRADRDPTELADRARRRWHAGDLVWRADGEEAVIALARITPGHGARALAAALHEAGADLAAAALVEGDLATAAQALAEAGDALTVMTSLPTLGPAATHAELGSWPAVARLWVAAGRPAAPAPLPALLAHPAGAELALALEATLDAGGDVARAARTLHVHRATLYRRLARAEQLTGLDLTQGDDRLRAHMALRMWRLAGAGTPSAPTPRG